LWNESSLIKWINAFDLQRIIIAGGCPGTVKTLFAKAMTLAGKDPLNVILASFNEHGICSTNNLNRAKALLACTIAGIPFEVLTKTC